MRHLMMVFALLSGFTMTGMVVANEELEAIKAECKAQAEEQGAEDIQAFVAKCVQQASQAE